MTIITMARIIKVTLLASVIYLIFMYVVIRRICDKPEETDFLHKSAIYQSLMDDNEEMVTREITTTALPLKAPALEKPENSNRKLILLWNSFWDEEAWEVGLGHQPFQRLGCDVTNCEISQNRSRLNESDAVLFHITQLEDYPKVKKSNQRWVFFMLESPAWSWNMNYTEINNLFDWTMTYRLDSDIIIPYGTVTRRKYPRQIKNNFKSKNKTSIWIASNCVTSSRRGAYIERMKSISEIDSYGRCGDLTCDKDWVGQDVECLTMAERKYKFYIAFENSLCFDYVTEKFFKMLARDVVPVVRGGADYSRFTPRRWYINAEEYSTPEELAQYLKYLSDNETAYMEYFRGRENYDFRAYFGIKDIPSWCDLCRKLNDANEPYKTYDDINRWWGHKKCWLPQEPDLYSQDISKRWIN